MIQLAKIISAVVVTIIIAFMIKNTFATRRSCSKRFFGIKFIRVY